MAFFDRSKEIADRFLQNIIFVDERAYIERDDQQHAFNAKAVSEAFARKQKLCSVFAPSSQEDVERSLPMLLKADVDVLDWNLDFSDSGIQAAAADDEEDAEQDDTRGQHTLNLITKIVEDAGKDKIRVIVVYTGETDLHKITGEIKTLLNDKGFESDICKVFSPNVHILVRAKKNGGAVVFNHLPELQDKICGYGELPELVLDEFTSTVYGLLPNYALGAMTAIRDSTSKILGVFSKDLDAAYLGHQVAIPDREDGPRLLAEIFGTSIKELLEDSHFIDAGMAEDWITEHVVDGTRKITIKKETNLTQEKVLKIWNSDKLKLEDKIHDVFGEKIKDSLLLTVRATELFADNPEEKNKHFAVLTQMRNTFGPASSSKKLTQGTIVETSGHYYVCVQPRCDTGRIEAKEEGQNAERNFLFLPLSEKGKGHAVVVDDKILIANNKSYGLRMFLFVPQAGYKDIQFNEQNGQYQVLDKNGNLFVWKGELKELQAQRINTDYSNQLSRVGLDESEWLRLKEGK